MPSYVIGDVQGCFTALEKLLNLIHFQPGMDTLWFTGDLVNRGPHSLEVLRFVKSLGDQHTIVLGNHDLHLIAVAYGVREKHALDTIDTVLAAPDCDELIEWLRHRPLLHYDKEKNCVLVHAGLAPAWHLNQAQMLAREVENALRASSPDNLLENIFGNQPDYWDEKLSGQERLRSVINYLTRMRFCYSDGRLDLTYKGKIGDHPADLIPWFHLPQRANTDVKIIFGHWAALGGETHVANVYALDTGCVWGNCLTAMRLEDEKRFSVQCS